MTFAPKKALVAAALSIATVAGATTATTSTAQANEYVAGAVGFVAGTIVGSALNQAHQPRVIYQRQRPVVVHTRPVYQQRVVYRQRPVVVRTRPQPWTSAWYSYCSNRYRSFNPNTGYFLAYSGQYRFCR